MGQFVVFIGILINGILCAWLCFRLGLVSQRQKSLETTQFIYLQHLRAIQETETHLRAAQDTVENQYAQFIAYRERVERMLNDRMAPLEQLSVIAERLILAESGIQLRMMTEKISDLMQPIVGWADLTSRLIKKVYIGRDHRLPQIREGIGEIFSRCEEIRNYLGSVNVFNASIRQRHLAGKN